MTWTGLATGTLGGATTMLVRTATRRAMHAKKTGPPRLPQAARRRHGFGTMLAWAVAAGVLLAIVDVLIEQRGYSLRD